MSDLSKQPLTQKDYIKFIIYVIVCVFFIDIYKSIDKKKDKVITSLNGFDKDVRTLYDSFGIPYTLYDNINIETFDGTTLVVRVDVLKAVPAFERPFGNLLVQSVLETLRKKGINPRSERLFVLAYVYCPRYSIGENKRKLEICNSSQYDPYSDNIKDNK